MRVWCSSALASFVAPSGGSTTCSSSAPVAHEQCIDCLFQRPGTLLHNQQWLTAEGDCVVGMVDRKRRNMPQRCQKGERHHSKPYMRYASVVLSVHSRPELCTLARRSHGQRLTPAQREAQSSVNAETLRRERRAQACALSHESCSLPACHRSCLHARLDA